MIPLHRLLWGSRHLLDFAMECGWLVCDGSRVPDLSWELQFNVFITTRTRLRETTQRMNPTDALRQRLVEEGIITRFDTDPPVVWLVGQMPTIGLDDLMDRMKRIVVVGPAQFCEPIIICPPDL